MSANKTCNLICTGSLMKVSLGSLCTCRLPLKNPGHTGLSAVGLHFADCVLTDTTEEKHDKVRHSGQLNRLGGCQDCFIHFAFQVQNVHVI